MPELDAYLLIGTVVKPQGVKGEVKVKPETDDPARFLDLTSVFVRDGAGFAPRAMRCTRVHDGFVYLRFDGANDRDAAEALRGLALYIDRAHAATLPEDAEFICDLIGCEAFDVAGQRIGKLMDVLQPGANDVYVIETPRGELMLPALKRVVLSVDVREKRMVLDAVALTEVGVYTGEGEVY